MKTTSLLLVAATLLSLPALAEPVVSIRGVDPRVYLRARKPEPAALRELKALPVDVSVQILTNGTAAFLVDDSAYPAHLKAADRASLRTLEERALVTAALATVAEMNAPRSVELITARLDDADALVRAEAAERLGQTKAGRVVDTLARIARDDVDPTVRGAACAGLGRHRSAEALEALAPLVLDDTDAIRQVAAVRALGTLASKWAWQARGDVAEGERLRTDARALLARVSARGDVAVAVDEVAARLR